MAEQFLGVRNVNSFYSEHYLTEILSGDLRDVLARWREQAKARNASPAPAAAPLSTGPGDAPSPAPHADPADPDSPQASADKAPPERLSALRRDFFRLRERQRKESDPQARYAAHADFSAKLLDALGYQAAPTLRDLDDKSLLPLFAEAKDNNNAPVVWCLLALSPPAARKKDEPNPSDDESPDPLRLLFRYEQYQALFERNPALDPQRQRRTSHEDALNQLFSQDQRPRYVLLIGEEQLVLIDRTKWAEQRLLRFDWSEILGRRDAATLDATAALLHRESLCPQQGESLLDALDNNSHKHAFAVSEDLKYALREAIELLGNEVVYYLKEKRHERVFDRALGDQLTRECLRYMYRLLFLFYLEARPELGYAPTNSEAYQRGYSLERLRDLELVPLDGDERDRYHLHESIARLFALLFDGTPRPQQSSFSLESSTFETFRLVPVRSHLFDPERTPLLNKVKLRDHVLQKIVELMSLSRPRGRQQRGRISYAQLGINQLGAVYEALLSYRGFFAEHDLYEVKPANETHDFLHTAYFVPKAETELYKEEEKVIDPSTGRWVCYPRGTFIYRLAGRDREKSASYYTPEILTRCLVKYALKELLYDENNNLARSADEILRLTICEPAMGSAAFLNEAVEQLSEAYLRARQQELQERLPHDDYLREKQRVKMLLADNNVFGVDLNPVAVELAEVSLWLNTIIPGGYVPWFGCQLGCGNSLVGARRQVFLSEHTRAPKGKKKGAKAPWTEAVPLRVAPGQTRPRDSIYHFLLGDLGMSLYGGGSEGKPIKELAPAPLQHIDDWRKAFCAPLDDDERQDFVSLSDGIDTLWAVWTDQLRSIRARTSDALSVYGRPVEEKPQSKTQDKDHIVRGEIANEGLRASGPYRRLQMVLDYWCALWFWPIDRAEDLPSRSEYWMELTAIIDGGVPTTRDPAQGELFASTQPAAEREAQQRTGTVNVDELCERYPRLALVRELRERFHFWHWELEFADLFADRGGFDLILGNPPWLKVEWQEAGLMGDADPFFVLRGLSAKQAADRRAEVLEKKKLRGAYFTAHEEAASTASFLGALQNYPLLQGSQPNLYKCFLPQAWMLGTSNAASGFLHPEGVYDDPKGGTLREAIYPRLRAHYQFWNSLLLFAEVHSQTRFSLNVYGPISQRVRANNIANLYHPNTIDICDLHLGAESLVPGVKDDEGNWNLAGHKQRIVKVDDQSLSLFATLYDEPGTPPRQARLPALHAQNLLRVLEKFSQHPKRLGDLPLNEFVFGEVWHESRSQSDGTIRRETRFPTHPSEWIVSGPHFFVGLPYNKTPRSICEANGHYDNLDLETLPNDYLPRTNYVPACSPSEYQQRTPRVPWGNQASITDFYRCINREMIGPANERTLIPTLVPPGPAWIHTCYGGAFQRHEDLLDYYAMTLSVPVDFLVKSTGKGHVNLSLISLLPMLTPSSPYRKAMWLRALLLTCLTTHYADLWRDCFDPLYTRDGWTKADPRLSSRVFSQLKPDWTRDTPLRSDFARRQALVELDVLAALALGLSLDELQTLYRIQFPVLRSYEADTWFDQHGRIIFTNSKGLSGVGLSRKASKGDPNPAWDEVKHLSRGTVTQQVSDDTLPSGPTTRTLTFHAPFTKCDREQDYARAWEVFSRTLTVKGAARLPG